MSIPNTTSYSSISQQSSILYTTAQRQGDKDTQEDFVDHYQDECFVVTDGYSGLPNGATASELACQTSIWGYKHIRQRPFYWADKSKLMHRIFRSTNIALWQKRREKGYENGLASTLAVVIIGAHKMWVGTVGDTGIYLFREGLIDVMTPLDMDEQGRLTNALGVRRYGLVPHQNIEKLLSGDSILIASDGVMNAISEDELRTVFEVAGETEQSLSFAIDHLLETARANGSTENMTACLIKKRL